MWFYEYFVSVRLCILPDGEPPASSWTSTASDSALFLPLDGLRGVVDPLRQHQSATAPFPSAELPPGGGNLCSLSSSLAPSSALTPPELFALPQTPSLFVDFSYCHLWCRHCVPGLLLSQNWPPNRLFVLVNITSIQSCRLINISFNNVKKWLSMLAKLDEKKLIARHPGSELLANPSCKNCETMLSAKKN